MKDSLELVVITRKAVREPLLKASLPKGETQWRCPDCEWKDRRIYERNLMSEYSMRALNMGFVLCSVSSSPNSAWLVEWKGANKCHSEYPIHLLTFLVRRLQPSTTSKLWKNLFDLGLFAEPAFAAEWKQTVYNAIIIGKISWLLEMSIVTGSRDKK